MQGSYSLTGTLGSCAYGAQNVFHLSGKLVALHLYKRTNKASIHNEGGTLSPFLSRLACCISMFTYLCISIWKLITCCGEGWFHDSIFVLT